MVARWLRFIHAERRLRTRLLTYIFLETSVSFSLCRERGHIRHINPPKYELPSNFTWWLCVRVRLIFSMYIIVHLFDISAPEEKTYMLRKCIKPYTCISSIESFLMFSVLTYLRIMPTWRGW